MGYIKKILVLIVLNLIVPGSTVIAGQLKIRIATLVPEGTTWDLYLKKFAREAERKMEGNVDIQIFSGGVLGDEGDYINMLEWGKIDAAGVTVHGISLVARKFLVLSTPYQFKNYREVDAVLNRFGDMFKNMFRKKGYEAFILDHGFIFAYTTKDFSNIRNIRDAKVWVWEEEPSAQIIFRAFNVSGFIPSSFRDVLQALKIGVMDIVYTSPSVCIAAMWDKYVKYIMFPPLRYEPAVILVNSRLKEKLGDKRWHIFTELIQRAAEQAKGAVRKEQKTALQSLKGRLRPIEIPSLLTGEVREKALREMINEKIIDPQLLKNINTFLVEFRKNNKR